MDFKKRFKELLLKLIGVKGLFAIVMTVLSLVLAWQPLYCFIAWLVLIFGREAFKLVSLITGKGDKTE